jgi:hypothetical protein
LYELGKLILTTALGENMHSNHLVADGVIPVSITGSLSSRKRYCLTDWLELHGLTALQCEIVLARAIDPGSDAPTAAGTHPCGLTAEAAWQLAADALAAAFPDGAATVEITRRGAVRDFRPRGPRSRRPFTFPAGPNRPVVALDYDGRIGDLLNVAHEFGHAVQIAATGGFVPPVSRELCAFLSELALLARLGIHLPALHPLALAAWRAANRHYMVRDGAVLARALRDRASPYRYDWNYPVARVLASECLAQLPGGALWPIFENRARLAGILTFLGCARHGSTSCSGACLTIASEMR